tara:strand:+ start:820 stop:2784 length:1965 start_codon:yes stop_codon:yes gene_type:complete
MSKEIKITFPDGNYKLMHSGITPLDIAKSIGSGLGKSLLAVKYNNELIEPNSPLSNDGKINLFTFDDFEGKKSFWHSSSHIMAQVLEELFSGIKLTIGPPIENGFYYDVDLGENKISENDFPKIEKRMLEVAREKHFFYMKNISKSEAIKYYTNKNNEYKIELLNGLNDGEITFCYHDNFCDLCKGGHIIESSIIKAVKILNVGGAYWKGDEKNKQLTRIYGISFPKQKMLVEYLDLLEKAKERDHRKLGVELDLFTFSSNVGQGLPLWKPKGADLRFRLENFLQRAQKIAGYQQVITPHIGNKQLFVTSGHYDKYGDDSFKPIKTPNENEEFLLKPMNCPHHCEIFKSSMWSYRDLPVRYAEFGTVYRYEQSGELHGLTRVRGFTQDDAHIFCTPEQLHEEFVRVINLVLYVFKSLGFKNFVSQVSVRDYNDNKKYIGDENLWDKAEKAIISAAEFKELDFKVVEGEAAFYGPKLDFMVKDALGRSWQLGTIQVDYNLPERFDLKYKSELNEFERPVMIHRAPFGSMERFVAILIEHTGGNFPIWLTPTQVKILCISDKFEKYAKKVSVLLENSEIRAFVDNRNETIGKKIRQAEIEKTPYMIIIGNKEKVNKKISVRKYGGDNLGTMEINDFIKTVEYDINNEIKPFINTKF